VLLYIGLSHYKEAIMSILLILAIITITLALVCYTTGVWGEKLVGSLKLWNLIFFWIGLIFDTTGTSLMSMISKNFTLNIHSITGVLAILLMAFHALWATKVFIRKDTNLMQKFHKFSLLVWIIWLIPYSIGLLLNV
jgi:uncharacterized repeat protein (TIGR03987 family)